MHARASAKFVDMVEQFDASATIEKDGVDACGDSIMGLLMLVASKGTQVDITTEGAQGARAFEPPLANSLPIVLVKTNSHGDRANIGSG